MTFSEKMKQKAKDLQHNLVLPEGTEIRTIEAAQHIIKQQLASTVYLLGEEQAINQKAQDSGLSLEGVRIVNPAASDKLENYAQEYYELRKHKGLTLEEARKQIVAPLKWGAMMVRLDDAQAMVAGAENATGNVLVAAFTIIKTKPGTKYASSCFVMCTDKRELGVDGQFVFSDCATIPDPDAEQLSEIASAAADSCQTFLDAEPVVAMLSFSTKGSASHPNVDKVTQALELVKTKRPDLRVDGELQLDAAIVESVGAKKAPNSSVAGKANVLVFPDLQSGNIGYKLVQRLAGAEAYGPILQGFAKPVSDLSRGCSVEDIVVTSAITLAQSGQ
ncbi:MAG: phosphate acetyltransferase [Spirochaetota bacterium]